MSYYFWIVFPGSSWWNLQCWPFVVNGCLWWFPWREPTRVDNSLNFSRVQEDLDWSWLFFFQCWAWHPGPCTFVLAKCFATCPYILPLFFFLPPPNKNKPNCGYCFPPAMEENTVEMPESPDHAQDDLPIICAEWEEQLPGHLNKQMFLNDCRQYRNKGARGHHARRTACELSHASLHLLPLETTFIFKLALSHR